MTAKADKTLSRAAIGISLLAILVILSACGTTTLQTVTPPTATTAPIAPSSTPLPTAASALLPQTGKAVSLDACQLISRDEASALTGIQYKAGVAGNLPGGGKTCTYTSTSQNVFAVEVVQASDTAAADAAKAKFLTDLQARMQQLNSQGLTVTQLPNFADGALTVQSAITYNNETINGSAFGFRKGTTFVAFSDTVVGQPAPSAAVMQAEAQTVLGRLP